MYGDDASEETKPQPATKAEEPLILRLKRVRKEIPVEIEDENGDVVKMKLVEMTGIEKGKYLNAMGSRTKVDSNGKPVGIRDFTGLEASLIGKCLVTEADGKFVSEATINSWPVSTHAALMKECLKMNAMDEESREKEKNS